MDLKQNTTKSNRMLRFFSSYFRMEYNLEDTISHIYIALFTVGKTFHYKQTPSLEYLVFSYFHI